MNIAIFTEEAGKTRESSDKFRDYFMGGFSPVANLAEELEEFGEVEIHIISEKFGYVRGKDEPNGNHSRGDYEKYQEALQESAKNMDLIAIILTRDNFDEYIRPKWTATTKKAKNGSIWFVSGGRSILDSLSFDRLHENNCEVLMYERSGLAPFSDKAKRRLIDLANPEESSKQFEQQSNNQPSWTDLQ